MNTRRIAAIVASMGIIIASAGYLYFNHCQFSQIKKIDSYTQVVDVLQAVDTNTLVLFDVDETLHVPASVLLRNRTKEKNQKWLKQTIDTIFKGLPHPEDYYFSYWATAANQQLVIEPIIIGIIKSLQDRGIKVLALTNLATGSDYQIASKPKWRFDELQHLGIDFSKTDIPDTVFNNLPEKNGTYPVLYHGILATNYASKGTVLGAFLDYVKWKPSQVIFFDDQFKRVNEVAQEMCKRGIPFKGYQYLGAEYIPGELDKDVATLQLQYLVEHKKWLSDEQAQERLKHQLF